MTWMRIQKILILNTFFSRLFRFKGGNQRRASSWKKKSSQRSTLSGNGMCCRNVKKRDFSATPISSLISSLSLQQNLEKRRIMALRNRLLFDVTFYIAQEFPDGLWYFFSRTRTFLGNLPKWWVFQSLFEKTRTHECNFHLTGWLFSFFNPHPPPLLFLSSSLKPRIYFPPLRQKRGPPSHAKKAVWGEGCAFLPLWVAAKTHTLTKERSLKRKRRALKSLDLPQYPEDKTKMSNLINTMHFALVFFEGKQCLRLAAYGL